MTDRAVRWADKTNSRFWARSYIWVLGNILLMALTSWPVLAGMDVMTNHEMAELEGGRLVELSVSTPNFYGTSPSVANVTVVRFASDIYLEAYAELGAMKIGDYPRSMAELGDMCSMDSNYTMVYGPNNRMNPGSLQTRFARGNSADNPWVTNTDRTDRIHDRYTTGSAASITLGDAVLLGSARAPWDYFGSSDCNYPETQWDINWENVKLGVSAQYPVRMYGLVLRAEFDHWNTSRQHLRRFVIGSNNLYGYSSARPLVTSGWLNSEVAKLRNAASDLTNQTCFQLQRDPIMDQYWALSSFDFDPDVPDSDGSFRSWWFNTCMADVTTNPAVTGGYVGRYQDRDHGFFLMVDLTDKRFSGWNIIGGVNEYKDWPPLEQNDDHYFENEFR